MPVCALRPSLQVCNTLNTKPQRSCKANPANLSTTTPAALEAAHGPTGGINRPRTSYRLQPMYSTILPSTVPSSLLPPKRQPYTAVGRPSFCIVAYKQQRWKPINCFLFEVFDDQALWGLIRKIRNENMHSQKTLYFSLSSASFLNMSRDLRTRRLLITLSILERWRISRPTLSGRSSESTFWRHNEVHETVKKKKEKTKFTRPQKQPRKMRCMRM